MGGKKKSVEDYAAEAYQGIRRMFFVNEIGPNQKLSYADLAKKLKMSTTPVIQALKKLEFQGLVRHEPNRGYYTQSISLEEIVEIYDFRELIERSLLRKTITLLDAQKLELLEMALTAHLEAVRDIFLKERLLKDMEFHLTLAQLSGCRIQVETLRSLFDLLYLKYRGSMLFVTPMEQVDSAHRELFDCIAARRTEDAELVLGEHIRQVKTHAITSIGKILDESSTTKIW